MVVTWHKNNNQPLKPPDFSNLERSEYLHMYILEWVYKDSRKKS